MKVIAWEYSCLLSLPAARGVHANALSSQVQQLRGSCVHWLWKSVIEYFYHYLPSAWWLRRPNCIVQSNPTLQAIAEYWNLIITDSFLCPGGIKAHTFLDKIDPLNTDTLSWTVGPVLKMPILAGSTVQCLNKYFMWDSLKMDSQDGWSLKPGQH